MTESNQNKRVFALFTVFFFFYALAFPTGVLGTYEISSISPDVHRTCSIPIISDQQDFNTQGSFLIWSSQNITADQDHWIGFVNCDDPNVQAAIGSASSFHGSAVVLNYTDGATCGNFEGNLALVAIPLFNSTFCVDNLFRDARSILNSTVAIYAPPAQAQPPSSSQPPSSQPPSLQPNNHPTFAPYSNNNNNGTSFDQNNNVVQAYQTAMIVLYAVSGVVLGLFFIVVVTNIIKNRLRPSPPNRGGTGNDGNHRNQRRGIARAVLDSFPVYLFSLSGTNAVTGEGAEKDLKHDVEKGIGNNSNNDYIELSNISPQNNRNDDEIQYEPTEPVKPTESNTEQPLDTTPNKTEEEGKGEGENNHIVLENTSIPTLSNPTLAHLQESRPESMISSNHVTEEQLTCPICLGDFEAGEELRILPCHHQYHTSCIDPWLLDISPLCPMCKADYTTWNIDVSGVSSSDGAIPSTDSNVPDNDDVSSQASSESPQIFPHFRWIKYLTAIRRAGRRRRRSRRPASRISVQPPRVAQTVSNDTIINSESPRSETMAEQGNTSSQASM